MLKVAGLAVAVAVGLAIAGPNFGAALAGRARAPEAKTADRHVPTPGRVTLAADQAGHYRTDASINGKLLPMMVDTGATSVVLRYEDASLLGLIAPGDRLDVAIQTANGAASAKRVRLGSVRVGSIVLRDVDAIVTPPGILPENLLGMAFLGRLDRMEARSGRLVLED